MGKKTLFKVIPKETLIRYAFSTLISFVTGFLGSLVVFLDMAEDWSDLSLKAVLGACLFSGIRVAVKYFVELLPKFEA